MTGHKYPGWIESQDAKGYRKRMCPLCAALSDFSMAPCPNCGYHPTASGCQEIWDARVAAAVEEESYTCPACGGRGMVGGSPYYGPIYCGWCSGEGKLNESMFYSYIRIQGQAERRAMRILLFQVCLALLAFGAVVWLLMSVLF